MSAERIRELNDQFRTAFRGGRVMMTSGVDALPSDVKAMVIRMIATFSDFTPDNDPYGEHDFGNFEDRSERLFFKIDYYGPNLAVHSPDPSDPKVTKRVITIMLAEEY